MKRQILVVEDDPAIRQGIVDALDFEGFAPIEADTGPRGVEMAVATGCELVLLDLVLPGKDGLDVLQEIRRVRPILPVIILTARGGETDRINGLRLGADDYVVKPFSVKELIARVEAVLRRSPARPADVDEINLPAGVANFSRREILYADGGRNEFSEREADLLRYLVCNAGRPISRDELLANVWRIKPDGVTTRTIDMHVARLREKLRDEPAAIIRTVRGKGYLFARDGA